MKTCSKCRTPKEVEEFGRDKNRTDGRYPQCKECVRAGMKLTRKRHNAKRTEYNRKYRASRRDEYNAWERQYFAKNSTKMNRKSKIWRTKESGTFVTLHLGAKDRARRKQLPYELTPEIIEKLCSDQGGKCALTGIAFDYSETKEFNIRPFAPSVDRIDSKLGYTMDNVQMVCGMVNKAKNVFTQDMFDAMCLARARLLDAA